jgi:hypothetical protein
VNRHSLRASGATSQTGLERQPHSALEQLLGVLPRSGHGSGGSPLPRTTSWHRGARETRSGSETGESAPPPADQRTPRQRQVGNPADLPRPHTRGLRNAKFSGVTWDRTKWVVSNCARPEVHRLDNVTVVPAESSSWTGRPTSLWTTAGPTRDRTELMHPTRSPARRPAQAHA